MYGAVECARVKDRLSDNKLNSVNSGAVAYDVYGNVTSLGAHTYAYDDASNLVCVDCGTANEIAYAYDGNNRRVSRTKGSEITYYVQAANGDLILEYTTPSNVATPACLSAREADRQQASAALAPPATLW